MPADPSRDRMHGREGGESEEDAREHDDRERLGRFARRSEPAFQARERGERTRTGEVEGSVVLPSIVVPRHACSVARARYAAARRRYGPPMSRPASLVIAVFLMLRLLGAQVALGDLNTTPMPGSTTFDRARVIGDRLFFTANDSHTGNELWVSDRAGTRCVVDLVPGAGSGCGRILDEFEREVLFLGSNGSVFGLWRSDGTPSGTRPVFKAPYVNTAIVIGSEIYVVEGTDYAMRIWISKGSLGDATQIVSLNRSAQSTRVAMLALGRRILCLIEGEPLLVMERGGAHAHFFGPKTPRCSFPSRTLGVVYDGAVYFPGSMDLADVELWRSDGTEDGTNLVVDLIAGDRGSYPDAFVVFDGRLYWTAYNAGTRALLVSDGTSRGTSVLTKASVAVTYPLIAAGSLVYFAAATAQEGEELWATDGNPEGTRLVVDLNPNGSSAPGSCTAFGKELWFVANDGVHGREVFVTRGTAATTRLLRDVNPGPAGSDPAWFEGFPEISGRKFFPADDGVHGRELWSSDGTETGTQIVADLNRRATAGSQVTRFFTRGTEAFFVGQGMGGSSLWRTDGTPAGTRLVMRMPPGVDTQLEIFGVVGSKLLLKARDSLTRSWTLFGSEGSGETTVPILVGAAQLSQSDPTIVGEIAYFSASHPSLGTGLWSTDGTPQGTWPLVEPKRESVGWIARLDSSLLFTKARLQGSAIKIDLLRSDGTNAGTRVIGTLPFDLLLSWVVVKGPVCYIASQTLWRTDGTTAGTYDMGPQAGRPGSRVVVWKNELVYTAFVSPETRELRATDGTLAGTRTIATLPPGSSIEDLAAGADRLFLKVDSPSTGSELWFSDGTAGGTALVREIAPGSESGVLSRLFHDTANDRVFFAGYEPDSGMEFWVSDGTPRGTRRLADLRPGPEHSNPTAFARLGRYLLFVADDGIHGSEPFSLDLSLVGGAVAQKYGDPCGARIGILGAPVLGNFGCWATLTDAPARAPLVWCLAAGRADTPLLGCTLRVEGPCVTFAGTTDANGAAALPLIVPSDPRFLGTSGYFQAMVARGSAVALSEGLELLIGQR